MSIAPLDTTCTKIYDKYRYAAVAQSVEQWTENPCVDSSILSGGIQRAALVFGSCFFFVLFFVLEPLRAMAYTVPMNWLVFAGKTDKKQADQIASFFKSKKVNCTVIKADGEVFKCEPDYNEQSVKDVHELLNETTHCVCVGMNGIALSPLFMYAVGLLSGKNIPVFLTPSGGALPPYISDMFGKTFADTATLLKALENDFPLFFKLEAQAAAKKKLYEAGIPLTPDSFSEYIGRGDCDVCELFAEAGMDSNVRDSAGTPMLCIAARSGRLAMIKWLMERGADINIVSKDRGYTPLMDAVWKNDYNMAEFLVTAGADMNVIGKDGQPLMVLAVGISNLKICKLLLKSGADISLTDHMGMSALGYAKLFKKQAIVDLFDAAKK